MYKLSLMGAKEMQMIEYITILLEQAGRHWKNGPYDFRLKLKGKKKSHTRVKEQARTGKRSRRAFSCLIVLCC